MENDDLCRRPHAARHDLPPRPRRPINRNAFETYLDKVLVPAPRPGDIVVMDNLSSHKGPMIEAAWAEVKIARATRSIQLNMGQTFSFQLFHRC